MMASASTMAYTPPTPTQSVAGGGGGSPVTGGVEEGDALLGHHLDLPRVATNGTRTILKRTLSDTEVESPKKRRKQSTPVKIPTTCQSEVDINSAEPRISPEGKPESPNSPAPQNSTPSPNMFPVSKSIEEISPTEPSPAGTNTTLTPNLHHDIFKMDFGSIGPPWISDIQNKAEEWLTSTPLHNVPFSFPPLQSPGITNQLSPFPLLDSSQQPSHLLSRPMNQPRIRIFNPDAYCDLCNKEFCNKYFLKTHKANKHGIYTDLPPSELSLPTPSTSMKPQQPLTPSILEQQTPLPNIPVKSLDSTPKIVSSLLAASCDICQKKFCNKNFVKRHKAKVHGIIDDLDTENDSTLDQNVSDSNSETPTPQINTSPTTNYYPEGLPECLKPFLDPEFDPENIQYRWPMVGVQSPSLNQVREAIHRPRGLGIVNPEAFCEICCKEYCNKYFLRTHKMKRHGIMMPEDTPKESSIPSSNRTMQTSPLNLIMSEQTNSSESYGEKKDTPGDDVAICMICGVQVSQRYMKAHYEACHPEKSLQNNPTSIPATNSPPTATIKEELANEPTTSDKQIPTNDENISEDLKKLQTMILQLNNLNVCQIVSCNVCGKEFENKFYLQAHMMSEHGALYMKITDEKLSIQNTTTAIPPPESIPKISDSKLFNNDVSDIPRSTPQTLPLSSENININAKSHYVQSAGSSNERRPSISLAPTNSYCEICNKELCNKYFMKTHMQRMHGIEIENGSQIGGVVCNICNKELCSKYFLRVHKHNTHGIVEDGVPLPQARQSTDDTAQSNASGATTNDQSHSYSQSDSALKPNELGDLNHRYFAHFTEVCPICSRRFRSTKWLKAHLLTDHGKSEHDKWEDIEVLLHKQSNKQIPEGSTQKQHESDNGNSGKVPNGGPDEQDSKVGIQNLLTNIFGPDELNSKKYYCSYAFCNFSTPVLAFLFVHERSHGQTPIYNKGDNVFQCFICNQNLQSTEDLQQHLVVHHANIAPKTFFKASDSNNPIVKSVPTDVTTPRQSDFDKIRVISPVKVKEDSNGNEGVRSMTKGSSKKDPTQIPTDSKRLFSSDISQTLYGYSQQMQMPTTYALPQMNQEHGDGDQESKEGKSEDKYVMQPFLIEECNLGECPTSMGVQLRLVPSLVFLPVREKITAPVTTSIKLTPT